MAYYYAIALWGYVTITTYYEYYHVIIRTLTYFVILVSCTAKTSFIGRTR